MLIIAERFTLRKPFRVFPLRYIIVVVSPAVFSATKEATQELLNSERADTTRGVTDLRAERGIPSIALCCNQLILREIKY